ncbi:MAG TPA: flagellar basal body rod C-terminal domain-containing protein [Rhodanobacter sp.]
MGIEQILEASRAGLQNERLRMDVASRNIALANTPITPADVQKGTFEGALAADGKAALATRTVLDPTHPMADAQGFVHYPAVDLVHEMTTMLTASRGYEANVRSFNVLRSMILRSLELGAK